VPPVGRSYNPAVVSCPTGAGDGHVLVRGGRLPDWGATAESGSPRMAPGRPVDIRIAGGRIVAVEPGLNPHTGEDLLQVFGTIVLPGLHDHHLHLRSLVAAGRSIQVSPEEVRGRDELASTLQRAPVDRLGWRRAVGYHESVAGELNRWSLDAIAPGPPTRVQHRSGTLWMVNSAAVDFLGLEALDTAGVERDEQGQATGRLVRMDDWLARRLPDEDPVTELAAVSRHMAARGLTGVTDATPDATPDGVDGLAGAVEDGRLLQRLHLMCAPHVDVPAHPLVTRGPQKVMLDDDRLPALDDLIDVMRCAHGCGVSVAVHCVTPAQLALTVAAFEAAGVRPGDRVEHGSVVAAEFIPVLARARLTLVTNPGFVFARGDSYLEDVDEHDVPFLYPCASLLDGGVTVAAGTDAPFGPADPWTAIRAAVSRRTRGGRSVGASEAVSLATAIALFTGAATAPGHPRSVTVGQPGDLCLLADGAVPEPGQSDAVAATLVAGRLVHRAG